MTSTRRGTSTRCARDVRRAGKWARSVARFASRCGSDRWRTARPRWTTRPPGSWATPSRSPSGALGSDNGDLYVDAVLHVPCRYLRENGAARRVHAVRIPGPSAPARVAPSSRGGWAGSGFGSWTAPGWSPGRCRSLPLPERSLPVLASDEPLRCRPLPDRRQHPGRRVLPRPAGRDHVHQGRAPAGGSGAFPPLAVSLQGGAGWGLLPRGRDDLRLRLPGDDGVGLLPPRPGPGRRSASQARSLLRMAPEEPGPPPGLRVRPTSQKATYIGRLTVPKCARARKLPVLKGDPTTR